MKNVIALLALVGATGLVAASVPSAIQALADDPAKALDVATKNSGIRPVLLATLDQAFEESLAEYEAGRSTLDSAIRLNEEIYKEQIGLADLDQRVKIMEEFIARARKIESSAKQNLDNGAGTSSALLAAKASRLKGQLELHVLRPFSSVDLK